VQPWIRTRHVPTPRRPHFEQVRGPPPEALRVPPRNAPPEGANAHRGLAVLDGQSHIGGRARRRGPLDPTAPGPKVTAGSEAPRGWGSSGALAPGWTETRRVALCPHPQPVVKIALRPEVLQGNEQAPAGSERPRERDGSVGRIAVQSDGRPGWPGGTAAAKLRRHNRTSAECNRQTVCKESSGAITERSRMSLRGSNMASARSRINCSGKRRNLIRRCWLAY
jgi:hypothetical protein